MARLSLDPKDCCCEWPTCGGEAYDADEAFCGYCAGLDGEVHCPKCQCGVEIYKEELPQ